MTEKIFDFAGNYITLDGGVFATAKNRQNAELINRTLNQLYDETMQLKKENKELQERNQRQAKTIRQLYNLIENKDWETLTVHMMELKKAEEQLQREWRCYE